MSLLEQLRLCEMQTVTGIKHIGTFYPLLAKAIMVLHLLVGVLLVFPAHLAMHLTTQMTDLYRSL